MRISEFNEEMSGQVHSFDHFVYVHALVFSDILSIAEYVIVELIVSAKSWPSDTSTDILLKIVVSISEGLQPCSCLSHVLIRCVSEETELHYNLPLKGIIVEHT